MVVVVGFRDSVELSDVMTYLRREVDRVIFDLRARELRDTFDQFRERFDVSSLIEDMRLALKRDYYEHRVETRRRELYRDGVPAMRSVCAVRPAALAQIPRFAREPKRARCTGWHPRRSRR